VRSGGRTPTFLLRDAMSMDPLESEIERQVEALGYEFVELERAGSRTRPILRLRIDLPEERKEVDEHGRPRGVTVEDCARVSRAIEPLLDQAELGTGGRYVLEVSSPGVERPLVKRRDWERFTGREIAIRGHGALAGRGRRLQGELLGLVDRDGEEVVRLRLENGEEIEVPRSEIARAHLVFRWEDAG